MFRLLEKFDWSVNVGTKQHTHKHTAVEPVDYSSSLLSAGLSSCLTDCFRGKINHDKSKDANEVHEALAERHAKLAKITSHPTPLLLCLPQYRCSSGSSFLVPSIASGRYLDTFSLALASLLPPTPTLQHASVQQAVVVP